MKIAFWSNIRQQGAVTTNLACMAAMSSVSGMSRSILLENHYNLNNLGSVLLTGDRELLLKENAEYYNKYGIEYLLKRLYSGESGDELVQRASVPLLYSNMLYLPQGYIVNKEVFNYEFELVRTQLFQCLEKVADMVFIDTESNGNASSISILNEADLVVVNLNQDLSAWEQLTEEYSSIAKRCVFLVGGYQKDIRLNLRMLRSRFKIPRERIGVIPYNLDLQSAMQEGRLLQFINRSYLENSSCENAYLMQELKRSASMLRENVVRARLGRNTGWQQNWGSQNWG